MRIRWLVPLTAVSLLSACPWDGKNTPTPPGGGTTTYSVGGTVSGLNGSVTLTNNGGDARTVTTNGAFTFASSATSGSSYSVAVSAQPATQTCTVTNGAGSVASSNVSNVTVTCATNMFTVGGTVTGLTGTGLVLQNNAGDNLTRSAAGAFTFATSIAQGSAYNVTVLTQPNSPTQTCTPSSNSGTVTANVTTVAITCVATSTVGSAVIGPAGGTVNGYYGATITVPSGALSNTVTIGLSRDSTNSPAFAATDVDAIGATYELTPHGQFFSTPVTVRIPFDPAQLPNDETPVLYKAETGGAFTALPTTVDGNFLEANISGFSWIIPASQASKPRMVYAIQRNAQATAYELASFKINKTTGALSAASSTAPIGESATAVIAHPSRRFVYVTHGGSSTVNNIPANGIAVYNLSTVNGKVLGSAASTATTSGSIGYAASLPTIHPSGKFMYVINYGFVYSNGGGDIDVFSINGNTGALTRTGPTISGGGAQPVGIAFDRLGARAYVLYSGATSTNPYSTLVQVYTVNQTTGEFTGPISGASTGILGNNPTSIAMDPNGKFVYVTTTYTDEIIAYAVNSTTGALTNVGSVTVTAGSKLNSLAIDSFGRFLHAGRKQPWFTKNLLSYTYNATTGALGSPSSVLTSCPGGACTNAIWLAADPQGQYLYAVDSGVQLGLSGFSVNQTTGALTAVNSLTGIMTIPFAVTGASPVWQNNCTFACAMSGTVSSGGGGPSPTNPSPPTSNFLTVSQGAYIGVITSSPGGINYGPPTQGNAFSAQFPANSSVTLCASSPAQPAGAYDITWSGNCSGTSMCTSVSMTSDKQCHAEFSPVSAR